MPDTPWPSQKTLAREAEQERRADAVNHALEKSRAATAQCLAALALLRICAIAHDVPDDHLVDAASAVKRTFQDIEEAISHAA